MQADFRWEAGKLADLCKLFVSWQYIATEERTRILEFGRLASENRKKRGEGKPETFDFLGFTFYCGTDRAKRFFRCKVKTSKKKFRSKVRAMKEWIKAHRMAPL